MNEFELINRYFKRDKTGHTVALGIGDDCSLLNIPSGEQLVVSVDTLVADVHFPANANPEAIAERALCVSLSDLAAMGASPRWFTLCLSLPEASEQWLAPFSRGLMQTANTYGCELVGGDTTKGALTISVQVMGSVVPGNAFLRSGAAVGDTVYVTGTLGDGAAALAALKNTQSFSAAAAGYLKRRYYHPRPRFNEAARLAGYVSSAIDISDGLVADLGHICSASGVGADIFIEQLPLSPALSSVADVALQQQWALTGGDDYQLCFTVPAAHIKAVELAIAEGLQACQIGRVNEGSGVSCLLAGEKVALRSQGYNHFG